MIVSRGPSQRRHGIYAPFRFEKVYKYVKVTREINTSESYTYICPKEITDLNKAKIINPVLYLSTEEAEFTSFPFIVQTPSHHFL